MERVSVFTREQKQCYQCIYSDAENTPTEIANITRRDLWCLRQFSSYKLARGLSKYTSHILIAISSIILKVFTLRSGKDEVSRESRSIQQSFYWKIHISLHYYSFVCMVLTVESQLLESVLQLAVKVSNLGWLFNFKAPFDIKQ